MTGCEDVRIELESPEYAGEMDLIAPGDEVFLEIKVPEGGTGLYDKYEGAYEVTPRITAQKLSTQNKVLTDDLTVREIPITTVTNAAGGNTIIIG